MAKKKPTTITENEWYSIAEYLKEYQEEASADYKFTKNKELKNVDKEIKDFLSEGLRISLDSEDVKQISQWLKKYTGILEENHKVTGNEIYLTEKKEVEKIISKISKKRSNKK